EHDLRVRRDRKAGQRPGVNLDRRTLDGAGELVFRLPRGQIFKAGDEQRRILAIDDRERAGFALLPVLFGDDGAVPAGMVELHGDLVPAVHLNAVDRGIDPAAVRIAHDHDRARADEGAAVVAVPGRRGEHWKGGGLWPDRGVQEGPGLHHGGAGARGCSVLRFSIQALSASSGRNVGSMPSASAARCGLVVALVKMRKPRGKPLMPSNRSAGPSGRPAATSVTAPISKRGSAPSMRRSAPSLSTSSMNSRKSLYIPFAPAAADAEDSSLRALWSGAVPRYSSSPRRLKKDRGHGQASPHRAHRSR